MERADYSQYNTRFDSQRFSALMATQGSVGFENRLALEVDYVKQQLKTDLGERHDVWKSSFTYEIRGGKLYESGRSEPCEIVFERGIGRSTVDLEREKAELASFKTMQAVLASPDVPNGTNVVDFSPSGGVGSNYEKDYLDIHTKSGDEVISTRYKSNLTRRECAEKMINLNPTYRAILPLNPTDIEIKSMPVVVPTHLKFADQDGLARYILGEEVGASTEELEDVWASVTPQVMSFINTLVENPDALFQLEDRYIDIQVEAVKAKKKKNKEKITLAGIAKMGIIFEPEPDDDKVVIPGGGCGGSGSSCSNPLYAMEIETSIEDQHGKIKFTCPDCTELNTRSYGELLSNCQSCGSDKVLPPGLRGSKTN